MIGQENAWSYANNIVVPKTMSEQIREQCKVLVDKKGFYGFQIVINEFVPEGYYILRNESEILMVGKFE